MQNNLYLRVSDRKKYVDFSTLSPELLARRYYEYILYHKQRKSKTESSLYTEAKMIRYLFTYLQQIDISNLSHFHLAQMQRFYAYLKTCKSKQDKILSQSSQRLVYTFFKNFSFWLDTFYPKESPALHIFQKSPYRHNNAHLKTTYFRDSELVQIKQALRNEEDASTKCYLLISLYYGLRSGDIVTLKSDCLQNNSKDNRYDLHYIDHKQHTSVSLPAISSPVSRAIQTLTENSRFLREEANLEYLFLRKDQNNRIKRFSADQTNLLARFVKKHQILNSQGNPLKITSHMFRRTLATNMQSNGASLESIQTVLNHRSKRTTVKHYIKTKSQDYIDQISKTLEHMQIIASETLPQVSSLLHSPQNIRLADGYCTHHSMAEDPAFMCDNFVKRGNCYGCSKMVTTPKFLPYFRTLLLQKREEIEHAKIYGSHLIERIVFEKELIRTLIIKLEAL